MHISSLLEQKGTAVVTISGDATVAEAVAELGRHGIGAIVVSSDGVHIEGIVSERDVVRGLSARQAAVLDEAVHTIMTATVVTCTPEDDIESLMTTMTNYRVRHVPVVRGGELCGIVSIGDVVKSRIGELEKDRQELVEYIHGR
ncbi:MAG TPA: CBS domain-containing protein [Acidimicrobiales bacterium]|nr:CBS domain-containing protein [Acidimicrobiales bacterium]